MGRKHIYSLLVLLALVLLTTVTMMRGNDIAAVLAAIRGMRLPWLVLGIGMALLFVSLEGVVIWYLMRCLRGGVGLLQCIKWSFAGFFFSAITPSATGGQPMQVYYMNRSGLKVSESTPILMIVAVLYKLVLVLIGIGTWLFWREGLVLHFGGYLWLYYFGLALNLSLVAVLVFVMVSPTLSERVVLGTEGLLVLIHVLKPSPERREKLSNSVAEYQGVVRFFREHKQNMIAAAGMTFLQRCSAFLSVWIIYRGMGLWGMGIVPLMALQASVTIAVDLLPLPGSVGITELVSFTAFSSIFLREQLAAFLCISRGISFYLMLLIGGLVVLLLHLVGRGRPHLAAEKEQAEPLDSGPAA